jgi:phospholipid/cholesterol/gamma-HCH transport system substrate-binding protein
METQRPTAGKLLTMVLFAGSCVGLLLYLWISFGGTVPFAPAGYRFSVEFSQATELGAQAQVNISGVTVGRVVSVGLNRRTGLTKAVIEIKPQFAPRPANTRAILRAKTLLGETFVELSPGNPNGPKLPDGGMLPQGQVSPTVQLDQIFSTFDPATRQAFQTWMQQGGIALTNRGEQFNAAFADLYPFAVNVESVLSVLNSQSAATRALLREGGQVFSALSASPPQLQSFVRNNNALFAATAARDAQLAATFKALPGFLTESRLTVNQLTSFSRATKPLVDELQPAAIALNPVLKSTVTFAPELRTLLTNIGPLTAASKQGFPAFERFLDETVPWLTRLKPYLGGVVPVLNYINDYRREIAAFFGNATAVSQGTQAAGSGHGNLHYLRVAAPVNPEVLTPYQNRPETNRTNPYLQPGGFDQLVKGLPVFGTYLCTKNALPGLASSLSASTTTVAGTVLTLAQLIQQYYYTADPSGPPCRAQSPLGSVTTGQPQSFPHLQPLP